MVWKCASVFCVCVCVCRKRMRGGEGGVRLGTLSVEKTSLCSFREEEEEEKKERTTLDNE